MFEGSWTISPIVSDFQSFFFNSLINNGNITQNNKHVYHIVRMQVGFLNSSI